MIFEAVLLLFSQGSTTVVLGTTAALLITEVLTGTRSEETCNK
jgi:H+/gluconate symporter-like permease